MNKQIPLLLLLLAGFIFVPTLISWLLDSNGNWYRPFIVWITVIVITFFLQYRGAKDDV